MLNLAYRRVLSVVQKVRLGYWFVFRPRTTGVLCLIEYDGQILLLQHSYVRNKWGLPGGGVKKGESPEQAVAREVKEEVGIELGSIKRLGELFSDREFKRDTVHCFVAPANSSAVTVDGREIVRAKWFGLDALPVSVSTMTKQVIALQQRA